MKKLLTIFVITISPIYILLGQPVSNFGKETDDGSYSFYVASEGLRGTQLLTYIDDVLAKGYYMNQIRIINENTYLVIYGGNGYFSNGIHPRLLEKLKTNWLPSNSKSFSIGLNHNGEWALNETKFDMVGKSLTQIEGDFEASTLFPHDILKNDEFGPSWSYREIIFGPKDSYCYFKTNLKKHKLKFNYYSNNYILLQKINNILNQDNVIRNITLFGQDEFIIRYQKNYNSYLGEKASPYQYFASNSNNMPTSLISVLGKLSGQEYRYTNAEIFLLESGEWIIIAFDSMKSSLKEMNKLNNYRAQNQAMLGEFINTLSEGVTTLYENKAKLYNESSQRQLKLIEEQNERNRIAQQKAIDEQKRLDAQNKVDQDKINLAEQERKIAEDKRKIEEEQNGLANQKANQTIQNTNSNNQVISSNNQTVNSNNSSNNTITYNVRSYSPSLNEEVLYNKEGIIFTYAYKLVRSGANSNGTQMKLWSITVRVLNYSGRDIIVRGNPNAYWTSQPIPGPVGWEMADPRFNFMRYGEILKNNETLTDTKYMRTLSEYDLPPRPYWTFPNWDTAK